MFAGAGAVVCRNEAGEVLGWDFPSDETEMMNDMWLDEPWMWADEQAEVDAAAAAAEAAAEREEEEETERLRDMTGDPFIEADDFNRNECYCQHGNFIGNPYGADYPCGPCEMGE